VPFWMWQIASTPASPRYLHKHHADFLNMQLIILWLLGLECKVKAGVDCT